MINILGRIRKYPKATYKRTTTFIKRRPFTSFLLSLALLLGIFIIGAILGKPPTEVPKEPAVKAVKVYRIGSVPTVTVQGQVEKEGVIKIMAQTSGVVQKVNVSEGDKVKKGQQLINLSTNYQGDSLPGLQTAIASKQFDNLKDTFDAQKDLIAKQRDVANKQDANADQLRDIAGKSAEDTRSALSLNEQIISDIDANLKNLEAGNVGGVNNQLIQQTRQLKSQFQGVVTQLRGTLRNLELQVASDKPPAQLSDVQKDITLKQLNLQEKSLSLNKEVAQLQVAIAAVGASLMHPVSPTAGVVERIYVHEGQLVNPGTPLLQISGSKKQARVVVKVPSNIAQSVSRLEMSTIHLDETPIATLPFYISTEATDGNLYSVIFEVPDQAEEVVAEGGFVSVDIPIGISDSISTIPFIPIDAIFQTQDQAFVFVVKDNMAASKKIMLGNVVGSFSEVMSGLSSGDQIILDRNVLEGDKVKAE